MTIEEKLRALAACGLKLKDQFDGAYLATRWKRRTLDKPGWDRALDILGGAQAVPPYTPHCETLWLFDTECIEGDGSYVDIAKRMAEIAQGSLPLSDVQDHVDIDAGEAWLRFTCQGKPVHIALEVDDDWVDTSLFGHFVELLAKSDPDKMFICFDAGGQYCFFGCVTRTQYARLRELIPTVEPLT